MLFSTGVNMSCFSSVCQTLVPAAWRTASTAARCGKGRSDVSVHRRACNWLPTGEPAWVRPCYTPRLGGHLRHEQLLQNARKNVVTLLFTASVTGKWSLNSTVLTGQNNKKQLVSWKANWEAQKREEKNVWAHPSFTISVLSKPPTVLSSETVTTLCLFLPVGKHMKAD